MAPNAQCALAVTLSENQVAFGVAVGNEALMHECAVFSQTLGHANSKNETRLRNKR